MIDETLISACKAGDRIAQRQLYEYMAPRLYHTCKRYLKIEQDVEEALADTFFTIFTKLDQLKELPAFESWARRIAVNFCLAMLRKKGTSITYLEDIPQGNAYTVSPGGMAERDLLKLLDELPEGCRMVFNLFAIEGYSHKEIAVMLQISEGTSKSQLSYSKTKLKNLVSQFYFLNEN